jgi:hypothetical protein
MVLGLFPLNSGSGIFVAGVNRSTYLFMHEAWKASLLMLPFRRRQRARAFLTIIQSQASYPQHTLAFQCFG